MQPRPMMPAAPARRTRRTSWKQAPFAALDFETTGLDFETDTVVSFGVVPVLGGRAIVGDGVHQLVNPSVPPSPRSQTIHELRPQDLAGAPPLAKAAEGLARALDGRYLLVWFADVEVHFLAAMFGGGRRRWRRRTIDVRNLAIAAEGAPRADRKQPGYGLSSIARRYGVPVASPHDADDDALVTAQLFLVLAPKVGAGPDPSVRDLLRRGRA
jgi:DNA polymerase III subunit epsilon